MFQDPKISFPASQFQSPSKESPTCGGHMERPQPVIEPSGREETVVTNSITVKLWKQEQQGLWSYVYGHKMEDGSWDGSGLQI